MTPYKDIFLALNRAKVRYLVAGGVAVNLHQITRATVDLDLIVHLEKENVLRFVGVMKDLGFVPKVPVAPEDFSDEEKRNSWIIEKNMVVFSFVNAVNQVEVVDVFVREPVPFEEAYGRRKDAEAFGTVVPVLGIEDLLSLKTAAGRDKDLYDIKLLRKKHEQEDPSN